MCFFLLRCVRRRKAELDAELGEVREKLTDAAADRRERESEVKLRETVETLRQHFPSVRGTLAELCEVNHPKYALACSVALGRHLDSVVILDQKTAFECINYLKEQRLGQLTFIPLDTVKVKPIGENIRQLKGKNFPLALECLTFEPE